MSKIPIKTIDLGKGSETGTDSSTKPVEPTPTPTPKTEPVQPNDNGDYRRKNMEKARDELKRKREQSTPLVLEESIPINNGHVTTRVEQFNPPTEKLDSSLLDDESIDYYDDDDELPEPPRKKRKLNSKYPDSILDHFLKFGSVVGMSLISSLFMGALTVVARKFKREEKEDVEKWTRTPISSSFAQ
jgi:hypothetical protein